MRPAGSQSRSAHKLLDGPVNLAQLAADQQLAASGQDGADDVASIWVTSRDDGLKVDSRKLEKAQQKIAQKQEARRADSQPAALAAAATPVQLQTASASQVSVDAGNK